MKSRNTLSIGLIWSQFAAYHVDRCEAVARRFAGKAEVLAVEVATTSQDYAWEPSGSVSGARKITLFPGETFDTVGPLKRYWRMLRAVRRCDVVCIGLSYGILDAILLSWTLQIIGKKVVVFSESKFDDTRRSSLFELMKGAILGCYCGAVVGARRHIDYFRFLRFKNRPVLPGYDCVGLERIRMQAGGATAPEGVPFAERPFIFVGRFVGKKNLITLVDGYARYVELAGPAARRLVLVGSGEQGSLLRQRAADLGMTELIDFPGFLGAEAVSRALAGSLALLLVSREEQWGLVVNEALACGLPAIVSDEVGSRDLLVRNLVNGFVVNSASREAIARAMQHLAGDEALWRSMVEQSHSRAWMGDAERLADALEVLLYPDSREASLNIERLTLEMEPTTR